MFRLLIRQRLQACKMKVLLTCITLQQTWSTIILTTTITLDAILTIPDTALGHEHIEQHVGWSFTFASNIRTGGVH